MGLMSGDDRLWVNVNCGQSVLRRAEKLREIKAPLQFEEQHISKTSDTREDEKIDNPTLGFKCSKSKN